MNQIGMKYQIIHACPNDHIIYHKQHEFAIECPDCHIRRYQLDQITKKCLTRFFDTFPLFHVFNDYSGALAWHNLWITMHAIEVKMALCEFL